MLNRRSTSSAVVSVRISSFVGSAPNTPLRTGDSSSEALEVLVEPVHVRFKLANPLFQFGHSRSHGEHTS